MKKVKLEDCRLMAIPEVEDRRGKLSFIENSLNIPFDIKRVFYILDVPEGEGRADHANIGVEEFVIAMAGSFDVTVDDGKTQKKITLNRPNFGLYLPKMIWRRLDNFSERAICLVLASSLYDPNDYLFDHIEFRRINSQ
jgi:hypothetical protein